MKKVYVTTFTAAALLLAACGGGNNNDGQVTGGNNNAGGDTQGSATTVTENTSPYEDFLVIDVFSSRANYQGIQTGFFAQRVRERFNMELNIIAPNVAGGGDMLFQTRSTAGNLGDIVITGSGGGTFGELVTGGLLLDMEPYMGNATNLDNFTLGIMNLNDPVGGGIFGVPMEMSNQHPSSPMEGLEPTFGPYIRWDLYAELGYPQIPSFMDLLDVLEDMQNLGDVTETGQPIYALSLFPDWDGNIMTLGKQPANLYGYDEVGFVLLKADGSHTTHMLAEDSWYIEALRFFNAAFRRGILDPESATQTWTDLFTKYQNGQVLFSFWPWLGQSAFNSNDNLEAGKGFMFAPVEDMRVFSFGASPYGNDTFVGVGRSTTDPQRMVDFVDWLYSPEGIDISGTGMGASAGPEGLTWEMVDGEPVLTDFGVRSIMNNEEVPVPAEWGGGTFDNGISQLNFPAVIATDINPNTGFPYDLALWPSVQRDFGSNPVTVDWREHMGAMNTMDFLKNNDRLLVAPGSSFITPEETMEITTLRGMIGNVIAPTSWRMVYANTEEEFDALLEEMLDRAMGLGYEEVLEVDFENARNWAQARIDAVNRH